MTIDPTTTLYDQLDRDSQVHGDSTGPSRRRFLAGGGVLAAVALAAACSDDDDPGTAGTSASDSSGTTGSGGGGDLATAAFAASLEQLAVNTYQAAADAAGSGALGEVPAAVGEFVTVALGHHQEALDAWNGVLTGAGEPAVTTPPTDLEATVNEQFAEVTGAGGAAELALMLEQVASHTYLAAIPGLTDPAAITLAGQLQYVDQQHIAVLLFALGQYPVPEVFQSTDMAATPS